jgi:predicted site-specific integrase-resolvase
VSSGGQKNDLERQVQYMREKYPGWQIVTDVGSGLNWNRKGLRTVLRRSLQGGVSDIAIAHKDRLARFGFEIIEFMLAQKGVRIICDSNDEHKSREEELVDDIVSIVTVFSSKIYGRRKYRRQSNKGQAHPVFSNEGTGGGA